MNEKELHQAILTKITETLPEFFVNNTLVQLQLHQNQILLKITTNNQQNQSIINITPDTH